MGGSVCYINGYPDVRASTGKSRWRWEDEGPVSLLGLMGSTDPHQNPGLLISTTSVFTRFGGTLPRWNAIRFSATR